MKRVILGGLLVLVSLGTALAGADTGLFAEHGMQVDGATVRRIRDTQEHVVCYVVTGHLNAGYSAGTVPAISCLPEHH